MLVVNLFGAPGAGKSSGAAYIFSKLKMMGVNAELVTEFAKDKVWEGSKEVFNNQAYIFGKQYFKMSQLKDKVDVIITDSPLLNSIYYSQDDKVLGDSSGKVVLNIFNSFENINFMIKRVKKYNPNGRFQDEADSDSMHGPICQMLRDFNIDYDIVSGDVSDYDEIVDYIVHYLEKFDK